MGALRELIDPRILLLQVVGFIVLYALLRRYLFGPIQGILEQRRVEVQSSLDQSAEELRRAEALRQEYEGHLVQIREEARQRIQEAVREGQQAHDAMLAEARQQAEGVLERARAQIDVETRQALAELRRQAVELAIEAARKALRESFDEQQHRQAIDRAIRDIEVPAAT
jgi:F-type H+-transporting ATPase subunit b